MHALTGCDITSSFFGIGMKTALKTLKDNIDEFADLNKLCLLIIGSIPITIIIIIITLFIFILHIYKTKTVTNNISLW
jgi:hypothetical protein